MNWWYERVEPRSDLLTAGRFEHAQKRRDRWGRTRHFWPMGVAMTRGISHLANPVMTCWHVEERDVISGGPGIDKARFIDPNFVEKDWELHKSLICIIW